MGFDVKVKEWLRVGGMKWWYMTADGRWSSFVRHEQVSVPRIWEETTNLQKLRMSNIPAGQILCLNTQLKFFSSSPGCVLIKPQDNIKLHFLQEEYKYFTVHVEPSWRRRKMEGSDLLQRIPKRVRVLVGNLQFMVGDRFSQCSNFGRVILNE